MVYFVAICKDHQRLLCDTSKQSAVPAHEVRNLSMGERVRVNQAALT